LSSPTPHRSALRQHPRRIALFGGSFDPIHSGHLAVARAADRRFNFDEMHFILAGHPPHKSEDHLAPFVHRFAMVALACAEHPHFVPSLAEAGEDGSGRQRFYSIDTVRQFKSVFHGGGDRLFFILGADAFLDLPLWKEYEALLGLCDFIVASRPGMSAGALRLIIPPELLGRPPLKVPEGPSDVPVIAHLRRTTVYLLDTVSSDVSSTDVRRHVHRGQAIHGLVSARVEEYILKQGLYR
jgi:nicotinate-nucleotide adenylyltransferase